MRKSWQFIRHVTGFREIHTPIEKRITILETDAKWIIRGWWALMVAIILRPFVG